MKDVDPGRVQLDLTVAQAELLRDCLFTIAEQDAGQRAKILALHEQVMGRLGEVTPPSRPPNLSS